MSETESRPAASREVPVDWEALEDAFENNAPEVHSYLHLATGEVLRVVDGVADPQMHVRIASDTNYLRIDPVSSREQYRWMERFIPMVEDPDLRGKLSQAIDGARSWRRGSTPTRSRPRRGLNGPKAALRRWRTTGPRAWPRSPKSVGKEAPNPRAAGAPATPR